MGGRLVQVEGRTYSKGIWLGQYSACLVHDVGGWVRTWACEGERRQVRVKEGSVQIEGGA